MTVSDLGRKYKVAYNTVDKIIKTTKYGFWEVVPTRSMQSPLITKYLAPSEGASSLAKKILSLTFQHMIELLDDPLTNLSPNQLCSIVSAISPHIFKNKGNEDDDSSRTAIMEMFKATPN